VHVRWAWLQQSLEDRQNKLEDYKSARKLEVLGNERELVVLKTERKLEVLKTSGLEDFKTEQQIHNNTTIAMKSK
jgi:hypothetical protein